MEVSGVVDFSGALTDAVHPIDVPLGFNLVNGQAKVKSGCCDATETPVMLKHSTVDAVSIFDACKSICHMHKNHPTTMMNSCPHHDTATTKLVDLLHTVWSITFLSMSIDTCPSECDTRKQDSSENKKVLHLYWYHSKILLSDVA